MISYTEEEKDNVLEKIFELIEGGKSLRYALSKVKLSSRTFFRWIDSDEERVKQYARATTIRAELKFESIEADYSAKPRLCPETGRIDNAWVQLQRLKIDAKKWELSKLNPKKYGSNPVIDEVQEGNKDHIVNINIIRKNIDDD